MNYTSAFEGNLRGVSKIPVTLLNVHMTRSIIRGVCVALRRVM